MPNGVWLSTVEWMDDTSGLPCYLVEWYLPPAGEGGHDDSQELLAALGTVTDDALVRVMVTLAVPSDEVVFAVLSAASPDVVDQVCRQAGHPAQRVSPAIGLRLADH